MHDDTDTSPEPDANPDSDENLDVDASSDSDADLDRRTFLKRSAVGSLGFAGWAAQDGSDSARITRRMTFRKSGRLDEEYVRKIVLLTDRKNENPDVSEVADCTFDDWPTDRLTLWEGIIVDWKNAGRSIGFYGGNPTVEATQLIERNDMYLDQKSTPVRLGTAYIIDSVTDCPGEFVGVNAVQLPGIQIETGPGESTQG